MELSMVPTLAGFSLQWNYPVAPDGNPTVCVCVRARARALINNK